MKLLTRIGATLTASADSAVARFENHEAIGEALLERCRRGVAEARLAERRHARAAERLAARRVAAETEIARWTERARAQAYTDEATALACLERRRRARGTLARLDAEIARHEAAREPLVERVRELETRLDRLTIQHESLRSRATLARAESAVRDAGRDDDAVDTVFDRWETAVDVAELRAGHAAGSGGARADDGSDDPLAARLEGEETRRALAEELRALRDEGGEGGR